MKFDCSYKFVLCYYGQVNSLRIKECSFVISKLTSLGGNIYFAGDGTYKNGNLRLETSENLQN